MGAPFFSSPLRPEDLKFRRRPRPKDRTDLRGAYFRDTTAIIHSYPFRRLKHKTQVFFAPKNDHICTRIEHVMHVATVAATICRALDLDGDLAWAVGMGHDLGHTPFGHLGERIIERLLESGSGRVQIFHHELYSLRVVDHLANHGRGLNLTFAVRDGIASHCGEQFEQRIRPSFEIEPLSGRRKLDRYPATWEGCVVRMADRIAYLGRDFEDAVRLRIVRPEDLPGDAARVLGSSNSDIINTLVTDIITTSLATGEVGFSDEVYQAFLIMKDFNYRRIYTGPALAGYHAHFERVLTTLFEYLGDSFDRHGSEVSAYPSEGTMLAKRFGDYLAKMRDFYENTDGGYGMAVLDYLAGMTDDFALDCVRDLFIPERFS